MSSNPKTVYYRDEQPFIQLLSSYNLQSTYLNNPIEVRGIRKAYLVVTVLSVTGSPYGFVVFIGCRDVSNANTPMHTARAYIIGPGQWGARIKLDCEEPSINFLCPTCSSSNYYTIDAYIIGGDNIPWGDDE